MVMDQDIKDALSDIKVTFKEGLSDVKAQISDLVTQSEFRPTIERVDIQHGTLRSDHETLQRRFEEHEKGTSGYMEEVRQADLETAREAKAEAHAVREELKEAMSSIRSTTRWALGISLSAGAILFSVIQYIVSVVRGA